MRNALETCFKVGSSKNDGECILPLWLITLFSSSLECCLFGEAAAEKAGIKCELDVKSRPESDDDGVAADIIDEEETSRAPATKISTFTIL